MAVEAESTAGGLMELIEREHHRLAGILAGRDRASLAQRPASGKWTVAENVCHLVFAEHVHLCQLATGKPAWHSLELPPHNLRLERPLKLVGRGESTSLDEVMETWAVIHHATAGLSGRDTAEVRKALSKDLRHLRAHVRTIESLLRARR